jgi:steroid delta-isomerase
VTDPNHIRELYDRYPDLVTKGDVDAIVALYAEDATIEDPIGSPLHRGIAAVRAFYEGSVKMGGVAMKRTGPVRVAGSEAATPLIVKIGPAGSQQVIDIISVMTFDDDGRITSMRAYWSPDAIRPATPED